MRLIVISLILTSACTADLPAPDALVQEIYQAKVAELEQEKWEDCLYNITKEAKAGLDSLIHRLAKADLMDTIHFPTRPIRPSAPEPIIGTVQRFELEGVSPRGPE